MRRLSKRTVASRANGARSQGPVTEEGKRNSSINSLRHGLLAKCLVLQNESADNFNALLHQHVAKLQPMDDIEHSYIEEKTAASWRLRRLWRGETTLLDQPSLK